MKAGIYALIAILLGGGVFFLLRQPNTLEISALGANATSSEAGDASADVPESSHPTSTEAITPATDGDLGPQPQLANPPIAVEGIYLTGWSAGSTRKMEQVFALLERTGANAVVVDIKDYSGFVSYGMDVPLVKEIGADKERRIRYPNRLIKELHDRGVYVIGRVTVFQDPILAKAHPEWALHSRSNGGLWKDRKGLAWMDPSAKPVWDYNVDIAKDAFARGFDEINFDYIRFPSDGNLADATYPFWNSATLKHKAMAEFYEYLRDALPGELISADLFGLTTVAVDDLGIGQIIEDAYPYFDYISPMTYPSHYANGFIGYQNPAAHPYEVIAHSMRLALEKRTALQAATSTPAGTELGRLRPWIQDFDLGATYTPALVGAQVRAIDDTLKTGAPDAYAGYLVWDPKNSYASYGNIY